MQALTGMEKESAIFLMVIPVSPFLPGFGDDCVIGRENAKYLCFALKK